MKSAVVQIAIERKEFMATETLLSHGCRVPEPRYFYKNYPRNRMPFLQDLVRLVCGCVEVNYSE